MRNVCPLPVCNVTPAHTPGYHAPLTEYEFSLQAHRKGYKLRQHTLYVGLSRTVRTKPPQTIRSECMSAYTYTYAYTYNI